MNRQIDCCRPSSKQTVAFNEGAAHRFFSCLSAPKIVVLLRSIFACFENQTRQTHCKYEWFWSTENKNHGIYNVFACSMKNNGICRGFYTSIAQNTGITQF